MKCIYYFLSNYGAWACVHFYMGYRNPVTVKNYLKNSKRPNPLRHNITYIPELSTVIYLKNFHKNYKRQHIILKNELLNIFQTT